MRKQVLVILVLSLILTVTACGTSSGGGESKVGGDETATFQATILEIQDGYYLVERRKCGIEQCRPDNYSHDKYGTLAGAGSW